MILLALCLTAQVDPLIEHHRLSINEGTAQVATLTAWGSASIAAGAAIAIAKRNDQKWLTFGLFTAAVGAINVGFGVAGLVQYGNERLTLQNKTGLMGEQIRDYKSELIARHRTEATTYAFNFGLDFFYVATGALLWIFGERYLKNAVLHGMGMAGVIQGVALFAFDLASWILAESRGTVVARMQLAF